MTTRVLLLFVLGAFLPSAAAAAPRTLVAVGGATVTRDDQTRTWTIGNDQVRLTAVIDSRQAYKVTRLDNVGTGRKWTRTEEVDTTITLAGSRVTLGPPGALQYQTYHALELPTGVELQVVFEHQARRVRAVRHYAVYSQAPVVEMWTTLETLPGAAAVTVSDLNTWELTLEPGTVRWVTGLDVPEDQGGPFAVRHRKLATPERFDLGSDGRSSSRAVPWFALESNNETLYGGLMWSGTWLLRIDAMTVGFHTALGLGAMRTSLGPDQPIDGPHGFVGVGSDAGASVAAGMRAFVEQGLRGGRSLQPRVVFNTWYGHGTRIDEETIGREMYLAAELGAERFVIDAGWAAGSGRLDDYDFTSGLGRFTADAERFPSGLRGVSDHAHGLGLQFGLWVEPERVDLETVFLDEAVSERWLAKRDGRYFPGRSEENTHAGQLCLADPEARQWLLDRLTAVIEEAQVDYLKWDNNDWVDCNREDHGHGTEDGNFAHVSGLYQVLAALRERFPDLVIENCASGGHRLDFGMMRYTDVGWMDDRSGPAAHVRRNLAGLTTIFPPAYLFSFVVNDDAEPLHEAADIRLLFRSRMPGVLGLAFPEGLLFEGERAEALREVAIYRSLRDIQASASAMVLEAGAAGWEVTQETSAGAGQAILFAFQTDPDAMRLTVHPVGLQPEARYEVRSVDTGVLGTLAGADLMEAGIEIEGWSLSAAHILVLSVVPDEEETPPETAAVIRRPR